MKEWDGKDAQEVIKNLLLEEASEEELSEERCEELAAKIVAILEKA